MYLEVGPVICCFWCFPLMKGWVESDLVGAGFKREERRSGVMMEVKGGKGRCVRAKARLGPGKGGSKRKRERK